MPYLNKNFTKLIRKTLKKRYPDFKFSVRTVHNSSLRVVIREAPFSLLEDVNDTHEQINHFHIDDFYKDKPRKRDLLNEIVSLMTKEQYEEVYDGDYGSIPSYYIDLNIGEWNRPFKVVK